MTRINLSTVFLVMLLAANIAITQESAADETTTDEATKADVEQAKLFEKFRETLAGSKLVGSFTVTGREDGGLKEEEYTINDVRKMEKGDYWLFTARVKYGKYDLTVPMPLEVKWAGDTPIITLSDVTIPGLGTFTSRVVIYNNKYAGTWTHGEVGGHLFGRIEKVGDKKDGDTK